MQFCTLFATQSILPSHNKTESIIRNRLTRGHWTGYSDLL
jgi:hypothetical protein